MAFKRCPQCKHELPAGAAVEICPACGLVFAKWVRQALGASPADGANREEADAADAGAVARWLDMVTDPGPRLETWQWRGRAVLYAVFFFWGWHFIRMNSADPVIMQSFMHPIDLAFHEAGHVVFRPFGRFMTILGGTLGQLLMPMIVGVALVARNRDTFGASLAAWWLGQSLMDCAPYIADARTLSLPLVGGGTGADRPGVHDWENILLDLDWIERDQQIAAFAHGAGALVMLVAFAWGGYILMRSYQNLRDIR